MYNIIASFRIADDVENPKSMGIRSGYAPHHKFAALDYLVSGVHLYDDDVLHYPGEMLLVKISFPSWCYFFERINVGDLFEVLELDRIVGYGTVEKIF